MNDLGAAAMAALFSIGGDSVRRLMWFTLGFSGACGLSWYLLPAAAGLPCAGLFLIAGFCCFIFGKSRIWRRIGIFCIGLVVGLTWMICHRQFYLRPAEIADDTCISVTITASDYAYETDYGMGINGTLELGDRSYKVRAYLDGNTFLSPGDQLTGDFLLRFTAASDARNTYHSGYGIFLLAYQRGEITVNPAVKLRLRDFPALLSHRITDTLQQCFPEDTAGFAKALLLGDTSGLSYHVDTALKSSGIRHVVAVSGLHVSILFALLSSVFLKKRSLICLVGIPVLLVFAAMAGFTPSVVRACLMCGLMLLGNLLDREYDGATSLSFAVLIMLLLNPVSIASVSLQLSAASVAGILLLQPKICNWFRVRYLPKGRLKGHWKIIASLFQSIAVSTGAMVFTVPLCAFYFGTVSLVAPLTNLLTLWVVSIIFYGLMAVCVLSLFWQAGAVFLAGVLSWPIRYILWCADILGGSPLSCVYTRSVYIVLWLVLVYVLLVGVLRKKIRKITFGCTAVAGLCIALLLSWAGPALSDVHMTVLDVGQGQSILLQSEGNAILVDCGGDSASVAADTVAEELFSRGVSRLDAVIITHADADHAAGLEYLRSRVDIGRMFVSAAEESRFPDAVNIQVVNQDLVLSFGEAKIHIFGSNSRDTGNENSLCVLFERENCAILITGDRSTLGERLLLRRSQLPQVDVLVAGHHGSGDATGDALLTAVRPDTVIISCGEDNRYGHPSEEVLQRLTQYHCQIRRTDLEGDIIFRR